ncbi:calcium-binding protein [Scytonema sp. PCC 10023]|uniref:calcium-binding protein n=1 Tax=Scytonema sp. PCC 10023 TaxID=1680591 RepID=UPI0039C740D9
MPTWNLPGSSFSRPYDTTRIGTSSNDPLTGANDRNLMEGRDGNDTLTASGGDDILIGVGTGNAYGGNDRDTLIGGTGADMFVVGDGNGNYYDDAYGYALIVDYNTSPDTVVIKGDRTRSDGGIGLLSEVRSGVGSSDPELIITTTAGTQAILQDDGGLVDSFRQDRADWLATGTNDLGALWIL